MFSFSQDIKKLIKHSLWSLFGTIVSRALMFFAWLYIANYFGKEINGEIGVLRSTINLFISFIGVGFGLTLTKYIPQLIDSKKEKTAKLISASFFYSFILAFLISVLLYIFSPVITQKIFHKPQLLESLRAASFLLFLSILNGVLFGFLQGFQKFKELSFVNIVNGISLFIFLFFFSKLYGVLGTFIGFTLSVFLTFLVALYYVLKVMKENRIKLTLNFQSESKIFYSFTIPAILSGLMVVPFKTVLDLMLVNQKDGYMAMGLFTALFLFHTLILMTVNTLNAPLITIMSKEIRNKNIDKLNVLIPWSLGIIIAIPFLFFPHLLGLFFGKDYVNDSHFKITVILIIVTTVLVLYKNGLSRIMIVNNLMWFSFFSNLLWGIVLLSVFHFSSQKNAITIALAYAMAYLVNNLVVFPVYINKKIIPLSLVFSKYAIAIWVLFVILVYLSFLELDYVIKLVLLFCYLLAFLYLFYKIFTTDEKN